jgi:hypothetical protein
MICHSIYFQWSAIEIIYQAAKKPMQLRTQFFGNLAVADPLCHKRYDTGGSCTT